MSFKRLFWVRDHSKTANGQYFAYCFFCDKGTKKFFNRNKAKKNLRCCARAIVKI